MSRVVVGGDEQLLVDAVRHRRPQRVGAPAAAVRVGRRGERPREPEDAVAGWAGGGDVERVVVVDHDAARGRQRDVELAVAHLLVVERREPHDELPARRALDLVAQVGGHHPAVGEHAAAVVVGVVLVAGDEPPDLGGRQVADAVAVDLEDPPAGRALGLARVLAGDQAVRIVGEEAQLAVDVHAVGVVGHGGDDGLLLERLLAHVGVEVVALGAEHDRCAVPAASSVGVSRWRPRRRTPPSSSSPQPAARSRATTRAVVSRRRVMGVPSFSRPAGRTGRRASWWPPSGRTPRRSAGTRRGRRPRGC